jgi:hypothetical protein
LTCASSRWHTCQPAADIHVQAGHSGGRRGFRGPRPIADYLGLSALGRRLHIKHRSPSSGAVVIAQALHESGYPHTAGAVTAELSKPERERREGPGRARPGGPASGRSPGGAVRMGASDGVQPYVCAANCSISSAGRRTCGRGVPGVPRHHAADPATGVTRPLQRRRTSVAPECSSCSNIHSSGSSAPTPWACASATLRSASRSDRLVILRSGARQPGPRSPR